MNFALAVYGPPVSSAAPELAWRFATAALDAGHAVSRVFFYADGVHNANCMQQPAPGEAPPRQRWLSLAERGVALSVCANSALRRGLLDAEYATDASCALVRAPFELCGLGQFAAAAARADRVISFPA
jgi:tRNA 2-thiouridine synthesizing protein D